MAWDCQFSNLFFNARQHHCCFCGTYQSHYDVLTLMAWENVLDWESKMKREKLHHIYVTLRKSLNSLQRQIPPNSENSCYNTYEQIPRGHGRTPDAENKQSPT